jgi:multidrug efflux pump
MSISDPFVHRPVGTTLLTIAIALAGGLAYFWLPVSPLPQVDYPAVQVQASLPGASPETMASAVATPLERQFGRIASLQEMTSSSTLGSTSISLVFDLNRNIDAAARDVQAAINAARGQLPSNLPGNPTYRKINPADAPVTILAITSDLYGKPQMYDVASSILAQKLSQVKGVGQVSVGGGALPAVRVEINPTALNYRNLSLEDIRTALGTANANTAKGHLAGKLRTWLLSTTDQLLHAAEYKPLIVAYSNGQPVRLEDIASVTDSVEDVRQAGLVDGKPAIVLVIFRQPGANIIDTVDRVRALMPQLQAEIPAGMKLSVVMDRTTTIRASVNEVQVTLCISMCLVVLVVFAFLRNPRTTFIPSVVVPVSLIGTFGVMYLCGYSIDNLSLMALTVATGFVVDDAIVVIENITRHREAGMAPFAAAVQGAREIGFTVISMSTSLVAVFIPILLMGGYLGRLFREFAVTLSAAIAVSMVVSLTATPMMCAHLLRPISQERHGRIYQFSERIFVAVSSGYESSLQRVLRHPLIALMATLATVALAVFLYIRVPKGFFPQQDTGRLRAIIQADQNTSFQQMSRLLTRYCKVVDDDPAVVNAIAFTQGQTNTASMFITLKSIEQRKATVDQVIARLSRSAASIPGATLLPQAVQDVRIGGRNTPGQYQYTMQADDLATLQDWAPRMLEKMRQIPGLAQVNTDQQNSGLQAWLTYDRATAGRMGISSEAIDNTLYDAFGQRQVSTMYEALNQYHVVMEASPEFWQNPDGLQYIYVRSTTNTLTPLSTIARYTPSTTPLAINHSGQVPSVTISFNLTPGQSLGDAETKIENVTRQMGMPASVQTNFSGTAQAYQDALNNQPLLIAAALLTVYIVLGILYESFVHPITILSTLPSAGVGALLALILTHTDLTVISLIGIILLIGIVKKNAIMMIDVALESERNEGMGPRDAIYHACVLRFRPIMMTTMCALLGGLPLALGNATGSELRKPLGIAIVGGLIFSQMLTLYTTPVIYLYLDRLRLWARHRAEGRVVGPQLQAHPA